MNAIQEAKARELGRHTMEFAVRNDGAVLVSEVVYLHSTRGTWTWHLIHENGRVEWLPRRPYFGKKWTLTEYGADVIEEAKQGMY